MRRSVSKGLEGRLDHLKLLPATSVRFSGDQAENKPNAGLQGDTSNNQMTTEDRLILQSGLAGRFTCTTFKLPVEFLRFK